MNWKILLFAVLFSNPLFATIEDGRLSYRKFCMECHGDGKKGAVMTTQDGWIKLFKDDASELKQKHEQTKAKALFVSDDYKKASKNIFDFLKEYASDSGNIPGCGDSCE